MVLPAISITEEKKPIILALIGGVAVLLLLIVVVAALLGRARPTTLEIWGLWEEPGVYSEVIADYKKKNPNVTVKYTRQSQLNYRDRLTSALGKTGGPDVVLIHNTWLPMFKDDLLPMPATVYSPADYKATFYPVVSRDFVLGGKAYGVPLEIDTLALYVNQDILAAAGVNAPTTWDGTGGFMEVAKKMTVKDPAGRTRTAGAAIGTATNVDHWQDIVTLMMLQAGVDLNTDPGSQKAADALAYYVSFAGTEKVWDGTLDSSTLAFAGGKVGMYFGPSWRFFDFKEMNPNLNFRVYPVPQLSGASTVNVASYWAMAVSKKSKNSKTAWDFLKFASGKEELTKLYAAEAKLRAFGEPYSRTDRAELLLADPNVGVFINSAKTAKSWYLASATWDGDTGINSKLSKYYQDGITSLLSGGGGGVMETIAKGVGQVLGQYGIK